MTKNDLVRASLIALPMHGQHKLSTEGYRTRDGHFIEWFGRALRGRGPVAVVSRPEPWPLYAAHNFRRHKLADNTIDVPTASVRIPNMRDRRKWWVDSLGSYPRSLTSTTAPIVVWNPFVGISRVGDSLDKTDRRIVFDLLDDWTFHYAFESVSRDVDRAYRRMFDIATTVTANSEATVDLAARYGRDDAVLLTNGCDPERFTQVSAAGGPMTVGYVGKIGKRVDLELVLEAAQKLPEVSFVFAGPILDSEYRSPLENQKNIELLGDVHYERVPELLTRFDIGWVPHRVGEGEVGGDVIKTYEYRAAGLPVLSTPILGINDRGLTHVTSLPRELHTEWLNQALSSGPRVARAPGAIPPDATWGRKAQFLLGALGLGEQMQLENQ